MMCKNKSSVLAKFKPLLLLPIIAALFLVFTCNEKTRAQSLSHNQPLPPNEESGGILQDTDPQTGETTYVITDMPTYNGGESGEVEPVENEFNVTGSSDAASTTMDQEHENIQQDTVPKEHEIFYVVEEMPTFNGGDPVTEFNKFIAQNLRYPESAAVDSISGRVIVQFCVNYEGKVVDPLVVRSVSPALDQEAIRVVSSSTPWTPGKQRGKKVNVLFTFPINFVLQ